MLSKPKINLDTLLKIWTLYNLLHKNYTLFDQRVSKILEITSLIQIKPKIIKTTFNIKIQDLLLITSSTFPLTKKKFIHNNITILTTIDTPTFNKKSTLHKKILIRRAVLITTRNLRDWSLTKTNRMKTRDPRILCTTRYHKAIIHWTPTGKECTGRIRSQWGSWYLAKVYQHYSISMLRTFLLWNHNLILRYKKTNCDTSILQTTTWRA
jgi:hypothetical protein